HHLIPHSQTHASAHPNPGHPLDDAVVAHDGPSTGRQLLGHLQRLHAVPDPQRPLPEMLHRSALQRRLGPHPHLYQTRGLFPIHPDLRHPAIHHRLQCLHRRRGHQRQHSPNGQKRARDLFRGPHPVHLLHTGPQPQPH
ncbi:hypothetical protein BGZ70_006806, partial [Mortierella alpina]